MLFERSFILKGYFVAIGITISRPNSQVSRIFRLINPTTNNIGFSSGQYRLPARSEQDSPEK